MLVVVSYDVCTMEVAGNRRLRKVAKACENLGQRVQKSVFECQLDPAQWTRLRLQLLDLFDPKEDSLRFYFLGANYERRIEHHGVQRSLDLKKPLLL
jgi:CRISPR-associated protein Cas2